jgi:hypothetical protein
MGTLIAPTTFDAFRFDQAQFDISSIPVGGETGAGVDALPFLLATLLNADTGVGVDSVVALLEILNKYSSDTGAGIEEIISRAIALTDTGMGVEDAIRQVIRIILLHVITSQVHQIHTATSSPHDVKVITGG